MIITRTRTHKFNMAQYESLEISATVQLDTDELPEGDNWLVTVNGLLDDVLQEDIDRADQTSRTPEEDTHVHEWKDSL